ncbi:MAG TPA: BamA/TamA family outer membrane protein [Rhizomicrobium sp.]|nr:BamA/TamA family outer membrane protein [Rhizomicrobium sp.]
MQAKLGKWGWIVYHALFAACCLPLAGHASQITGDVQPDALLDAPPIDQGKGFGFFNDTSFLVVPIPVSNPTIGSGGALAGAMFFRTDEDSKPALIGIGGLYTSSGTWGAGLMADIPFDADRYRAKMSAGYADVNYDFFGIGSARNGSHVSLDQSGYLALFAFEARVAPDFYIGAQTRYMDIRTKFNLPDLAGELTGNDGPLSRLDDKIATVGLTVDYDTRDKPYQPGNGQLIQGEIDFGAKDFPTREGFLRTTASYSRYDRLDDNLVLASHASLCMAGGEVPIFDLCMFGAHNDLRGYAVGRYQDDTTVAAQTELRWHAFWRIGFVAFAGAGSVGPSIDKLHGVLASGGVGLRFLASKEYGVNIGIDGAVAADGEKAFYIQLGEAF